MRTFIDVDGSVVRYANYADWEEEKAQEWANLCRTGRLDGWAPELDTSRDATRRKIKAVQAPER